MEHIVPKNRKPAGGSLSSAIAKMLADGPTRMTDAILVEEVYEGRRCIVARDDQTMSGQPRAYRPIHPGETAAEARDAFVQQIAKSRPIVVTATEADDIPLTLADAPGLEELDG
jgi:hypothetical protein